MAHPNEPANQEWRADTSISRWRLKNFKSVRQADVSLSPLTLLVGANSAGKSSLLQSILAVVQASGSPGNRFPLNGGTVRLGTVKQNRYAGPCEVAPETIDIGAQFLIDNRDMNNRAPTMRRFWRTRVEAPLAAMDWDLKLGEPPSKPGGPAQIEAVGVEVRYRSDDPESRVNSQSPSTLRVTATVGSVAEEVDEDLGFHGIYTTDVQSHQVRSTHLRGGFPLEAFIVGQRAPRLWRIWQDTYIMINREGRIDPTDPAPRTDPADVVVEDIKRAYEACRADDLAGIDIERPLQRELYQSAQTGEMPSMRLDPNDVMDSGLSNLVIVKLKEAGYSGATVQHDDLDSIRPCVQQTLDFLRTRVRYLGPLRDDPRVVYQDSPESGNGYVGSKGEFSAAVLQNSGHIKVRVPMPNGKAGDTRSVPLSRAVDAWADFLEIGRGFSTTDLGRLGLQILVRQEDVDIELDLTSVGTGVSQVLPVLVMCLQAQPGSLLMIEQPELHLNPRVQQRLADFLLAIAASGRQLLVETHSEYLVSRLRLRVAQDSTDAIERNVGFLFAERDHGCTHYREVEPNAFGGLENWPENFFDQGAEEAQNILRAAVAKRRNRAPAETN